MNEGTANIYMEIQSWQHCQLCVFLKNSIASGVLDPLLNRNENGKLMSMKYVQTTCSLLTLSIEMFILIVCVLFCIVM